MPDSRPQPVGAARGLFAALFAGLVGCTDARIPVDLLVENVTVHSGSGAAPFVASVAIRDGRFLAIVPPADADFAAAESIDGTGKFMTPGLWDAHAHARSSKDGGLDVEAFAAYGVTSIHDLGGYLDRMQALEGAIARGAVDGPNIYPAYFMLNGESFAGYQRVVRTEGEVAAALDELAAAGAAQVKVHRALSPDMLPVVVRLAHERGLPVTGHIPLGVHPLDACRTGMDGVEHAGSLVEALVSAAPEGETDSATALAWLNSPAADPVYECFARNRVFVTPTLVIYPAIARRRAGGHELPPEFVAFIEATGKLAHRLYAAGVPLTTGTDTSDYGEVERFEPGAALLEEMRMLGEAGIPPAAVIAMATLNAARAIGVDGETGSVEAGKIADFLLLSADPGADIRNFRSIVAVYRSGRAVGGSPD